MNLPFPRRPLALASCVAMGTVLLSIQAAAGAVSEAVAFQPGNPWTQEIGNVSRDENAQDYSVSIGAGKTFQVNLVTRSPNVFFKVTPANSDEPLVNTEKTGATTWSTKVATDTTYTVKVFVEREVMPRGETTRYALQIGQYGPEDMQPAKPASSAAPATPATPVASAPTTSPAAR